MTCLNARDTITQDAGGPLGNHFDYDDASHFVTSHCRVADGTWVAWINLIEGADLDGGTGDQTKEDWPSAIASATAIGIGYFPDDGSAPVVYELGIDACYLWDNGLYAGRDPCGVYPFIGDKYEDNPRSFLAGWFSGILDVQVHADGTNVWVVVLAREAVKYPFLYNAPGESPRCTPLDPPLTFEGYWDSGHSNPFIHDTGSGTRWWLYYQGTPGGDMPFGPYDDPGPNRSFRWQPARVTVFAGDIGGFTNIGTVEAKFDNYRTGLIGPIECAASPAESGVLHVLWAEAGDFGVQTFDWMRGQRINYTRWDTAGKTLDTDLKYAEESGSGDISDANWVWTGEYILRNDHGAPIAIVWPWIADGGPQGPDMAAEFWDLSSGSIEVLQTLDPGLVPTTTEAGLGIVSPAGTLWNAAAIGSLRTPRRSHFASSLYTDPTLDNRDVYLICACYADGSEGAVAFYRIPCDGSDTFDFMDGIRRAGYSIVGNGGGFEAPAFTADFVSDPDNIWVPASIFTGGAVQHLTRRCSPLWELLPAFPVPDPRTGYESGRWAGSVSPPTLVTDEAGDWLAGAGTGPILTTVSASPTNIAALRAKICRCCVPCAPREIHAWHRIP